jgi:hypothetical protein
MPANVDRLSTGEGGDEGDGWGRLPSACPELWESRRLLSDGGHVDWSRRTWSGAGSSRGCSPASGRATEDAASGSRANRAGAASEPGDASGG